MATSDPLMESKPNVELQEMRLFSTSEDSSNESGDNEDKKEEKKETETELVPLATEEEAKEEPSLEKRHTTAKLLVAEDIKLSRKFEKFLTIPNDEIVDKDDKIDALILQLKLPHIYSLLDDKQYAIIQEKYSWIDDEDGEIDQFQYEEIQEVVHHMTSIERRHMFDTMASKLYDETDEDERYEYRLVPAKLKTLNRFAKIKGGSNKYVCSGCGVLLVRDKNKNKVNVNVNVNVAKKKKKFNKKQTKAWRGYICEKTGREFIFHNRLCVKFRKAKEWIRDAIYEQDIDLGYIEPPRMQIDFLKNDDLDEEFQPTQFYTTFDETEKKRVKYTKNIRYYYRECVSTDLRGYDIDEGDRFSLIPIEIKYLDQREFAIPMFKFLIHQVQVKEFNLFWMFLKFAASYINTPKLISLLKESSDVLFPLHDDTHSGDDSNKNELIEFLTIIAEGALYPIATCLYISAYLKENGDQYWNEEETEILSKHFRNMANTIIDEIENEHLVAIILEAPTNIYDDGNGDGLSVIDIAIKYKMLRFLQNNKISRIATTLWYDRKIIHPQVRFGDELSFYDLFRRLAKTPAVFYFSPSGLNIIKFMLYLWYLGLLSWVTYAQRYNYAQEGIARTSQTQLWMFNIAFILYEFYRCFAQIKTYFQTISNINEFSKAILWIILFCIRFMYEKQVTAIQCLYVVRSADPFYVDCGFEFHAGRDRLGRGNSSLNIDCQKLVYREDPVDCTQTARHNSPIVKIYMGLWATQCVLFWLSLLFYLSRTRTVGPMLRMISLMIRDMFNFLFLMVVLWISVSLAIFYIIGDELAENEEEHNHSQINSTMSSCLFYGMLIMLGQQEWSAIEAAAAQHIGPFRIALLSGITALGAFAGTILLLNLLIAMLSNTYNEVSELSVLEVNYTRISQSYSASRDITLIPPPLNYFAFALMSLWFLCDGLITAFTARTKMLNDWFFTPLNRKAFSAGDYIDYKDPNDLQPGKIHSGYIKYCFTNEIAQIQVAKQMKFIHQENILTINKNILTNRQPTDGGGGNVCSSIASSGRYYCKYCRYFFHGNQVGNVEQVTNLFKYYGILLDEDDVGKLGNMLNDKRKRRKKMFAKRRKKTKQSDVANEEEDSLLSLRQLGVAQLCPSCYRPFYCSQDHSDETSRLQFMAEICSFVVFMVICYVPLLCAFAIPAVISYVLQILVGAEQLFGGAKAKRKKQQNKLAKKLKMSQDNDQYRERVVGCFEDIRPTNEYVESITNRLNYIHKKIRESEIEDEEENVITQLHQDMELQHLTLTPQEGKVRMEKLRALYKEWCDKLDGFANVIIKKKKRIKEQEEQRRSQLMEMMMMEEIEEED